MFGFKYHTRESELLRDYAGRARQSFSTIPYVLLDGIRVFYQDVETRCREKQLGDIKPSLKDKRHISANKRSTTKALHFMNIKADTFNPGSLVLGGPSLHSCCLLWFIHRCTRLFDMLSWEVFAPVWGGGKKLWKLEMDLPDSQSDGNRRKIYVVLLYMCLCECVVYVVCVFSLKEATLLFWPTQQSLFC